MVAVDVGTLAPAGTPVAFTVKIPSPVDGALISTNYFPATTVVTGAASAPTILNGPGLATAGNTDPNSTSIVDGIVPGLEPLRDAGYNVITWDPRGEFDSGGLLNLDSPAFEGQDVKGIINWLTDNAAYTFPAFDNDVLTDANTADPAYGNDDPAIGMVGGSYGGGDSIGDRGYRSSGRRDRAWHRLEQPRRRPVSEPDVQDVLVRTAVAWLGYDRRPDQPAALRRDLHRRALGILTPGQHALLAAAVRISSRPTSPSRRCSSRASPMRCSRYSSH